MKEIELWKFAQDKLKEKISSVLLVVADSSKSSPGRAGFKMILADDGEVIGTIGGGIMEHSLLKEAKEILAKKQNLCYVKKLFHNKDAKGDKSGLICGGTQTMIIKSLHNDEIKLIEQILRNFQNLEKGLLVINPSGISFHSSKTNEEPVSFSFSSDSEWQYEENSGFPNTVYIIGGGHVGLAVSRVMKSLGFHVIVFDHREDVYTIQQNKFADEIIITKYEDIGNKIIEGERSYVIIVTPMHSGDKDTLKSVIHKNVKYIGMMGSKRKIKSIFDALLKEGIDDELLKKVHTPIGIEIEAESPEEISISIAAEIIKVKNQR